MINREATIRWKGYDPDELSPGSNKKVWANCDDCGEGRWIQHKQYRDLCLKCSKRTDKARESARIKTIKQFSTQESRDIMSESKLKEKSPLPDDWKFDKDSKIVTNKECGIYLGCYIAEQILSKIFKDVKRMPIGNHGYDFICNNGYKIDVKSATIGYKNRWQFGIRKNKVADYFLCLAFEDRDNLIPVHLWLIPKHAVNHKMNIAIPKTKFGIDKWSRYEQPLDKVILCCDKMRGE